MTATAQGVFRRLVRETVGPVLRREGLQGSGQSYVLPDPVDWAQVGLQKSRSNTADNLSFTINLKITNKAWWDQQRRDHSYLKDTPPPGVDNCAWDVRRLQESFYPIKPTVNASGEGRWQRIGRLIPGIKRDYWWELTVDAAEDVIDDALQAILVHGIPWLRSQLVRGPGDGADVRDR